MKNFIGLDGGGSKTKCVLTDENLSVISEATGDASNFLIKGEEVVAESIYNLIKNVAEAGGKKAEDINAVVLGTTGAGRRDNAESLEKSFNKLLEAENYPIKKFRVESDARIALEGAFSGKSGSILIAGTGSIMFGKDKKGVVHRVGGFGRFIGDEGSGYSLGRLGFNAVAKEMDGRGKKTLLTEFLKENYNISDSSKLITEIYTNNFDIPQITPLVISAAEKGDEICRNIIEDQSDELIYHIKSMIELIGEDQLRVSLIGSTIVTDNYYANTFRKKVEDNFNNVIIMEPELPPALGAVLMAMEM